jgi:hypothetical protein
LQDPVPGTMTHRLSSQATNEPRRLIGVRH